MSKRVIHGQLALLPLQGRFLVEVDVAPFDRYAYEGVKQAATVEILA